MKLVNSDQMRQIDAETINKESIPSPELMENAGAGIAQLIISEIITTDDEVRFSIFCGKGNNGGDGFVVARHLFQAELEVEIFFIGPSSKLSSDALINFDLANDLDIRMHEIKSIDKLPQFLESDFIIDAIFGTGFEGAPKGIAAEIIDYINDQPQEILSIDLPSGLNAGNGKYEGSVVDADYTFTLALPKYGLFVSPGREVSGAIRIVPIGIPDEVVERFDLYNELITPEYIGAVLPERNAEGHKGDFGKLFVLAGSTGMTGAAALTAESAMRSGCGMVKVGCPKTVQPVIAQSFSEATSLSLPDVGKKGMLALRGLGEVKKIVSEHDAIVIGPGLGQHHETKELVIRLLLSINNSTVVDADGLNALVGELQVLEDTKAELILTPHPGEFQRLCGVAPEYDIHKRIKSARKFAIEYQTVLVLKGSPTVVADIDGNVYVNSTGNNGMATGGSGDVLSGIIGSFLAQGMSTVDAALAGVFMHGLSGDIAADELGQRSMIASDMIYFLHEAFDLIE